jgi:hypothetical protein
VCFDQGTLELAIKVDLVSAGPLHLLGIKCLSEGLVANRWTVLVLFLDLA